MSSQPQSMDSRKSTQLTPKLTQEHVDRARKQALIVYGLFLGGFFLGFLSFVGLIAAFVLRDNANHTIYKGHFTLLISTFIRSFIIILLLILLSLFSLSLLTPLIFFLIVVVWFWYLYRIVRGAIYAYQQKPVWF